MRKKDNRGFTLVELIVAIAILSIVALGTSAMIVSVSRFYKEQTIMQKVQYEAQLVMTQIQEQILDCNGGLAWDDSSKTLYIVRKDDAGNEQATLFHADAASHKIYMANLVAGALLTEPAWNDDYLLAENISALISTLRVDPVSLKADRITIELGISRDGRNYNGSESYDLRNDPYYADNWSDLWDLMHP